MVQLSHPYMTTGNIIALTRHTFLSKMMSLLFNMLSRFVIAGGHKKGGLSPGTGKRARSVDGDAGQRKGLWGSWNSQSPASRQQLETIQRGGEEGAGSHLRDKRRMTFITFHVGCVPSTACPLVPPPQISADKKTMGRFCGQLGSPLGNPPGRKEFMSQGNKMLLTFHSDFSNEENGTIMFYKGFLAYYQAVGEWRLCWLLGSY